MSDYIVNIADVSTYGCDPMSFEDLREEFEVLAIDLYDCLISM